ncbi:MAG: hypothetical protein EOO90_14480 [Pedobacter sp.]|nr:MAG: hypothetical protein EOO90_14480 [Pedobacter sp.]
MKISFINRPISGFIISIVFTIATSAFSFYSIEKFFKSEQWVEHTNMVRGKLESIISKMKDAETGQRGFLLTGNEVFLEPYSKSEMLVRSAFDTVRVLTADNGAQQSELRGLMELIDAKFDLLKSTIAQKRQGGLVSAEVLLMGKSYMDRIRTTITRMENREEILLAVRLATSKVDGIITQGSIVLAFLISLASTIFFYNRTVKNYSERLRLEQSLRDETANLERRIEFLKSHSERIGDGEYGIQLDRDQLR